MRTSAQLWNRAFALVGGREAFREAVSDNGRKLFSAVSGPEKVVRPDEGAVESVREALEILKKAGTTAPLSRAQATAIEAVTAIIDRPALVVEQGSFASVNRGEWTVLDRYRHGVCKVLPSVGRIEIHASGPRALATGFVVAPNLVMTNRHVLERLAQETPGGWRLRSQLRPFIDFNEERETASTPREHAILDVRYVSDGVDLAVVEISPLDTNGRAGPPPLMLDTSRRAPRRNSRVFAVGFPLRESDSPEPELVDFIFKGGYGVKCVLPGKVCDRRGNVLVYDSSTLRGNSGSCVVGLNSNRVVGVHFKGTFQVENRAILLGEAICDPLLNRLLQST